jgi:hypothetical protein
VNPFYYKRDYCRLCGSRNLAIALRLEPMPIATPNFRVPDASADSMVFTDAVPMDLFLCGDCGHLQILHVGNPDLQYTNYVYTTSLSLGLREHFRQYAREVVKRIKPRAGSLVVELGSNDGTFLQFFKADHGMAVLGVDPAREIARQASLSGIETIGDFFGPQIARQIRETKGPAKILVANNVIANIDNLSDWVTGVREVLAPDGLFVFETQYGLDVITKNLLDTVYHEHLSYFNVKPLETFLARLGMEMIDVERIWTKGGSIRVTAQLAGGDRPRSAAVGAFAAEEIAQGAYAPGFYKRFGDDIGTIRSELKTIVAEQHKAGRAVAGYGVSVGTVTLLPQLQVTRDIAFLVDDDPKKDKILSGPGYSIPVLPPRAIYERNPGAVIVFAWRYFDPIARKHREYLRRGGKLVVPLPKVSVVG